MKHLVIIGAGGHGKVAADIAFKTKIYDRISFLDDSVCQKVVGCDVIGCVEDFKRYIPNSEFFVAIGNGKVREKIHNMLIDNDAVITSLIHPSAEVACGVKMGVGCMVASMAVVGPDTSLGDEVIINTSCSVDHDCIVGDYSHISVGAHLAGEVSVGRNTMIGAGAIVKNGISVCDECMIGAGAVVVKNVFESGTYVGVPASKM